MSALIALLAVPILGTTYALVSSVSANIAWAGAEHAELIAFTHVIDIVPPLEGLHRALTDHDGATATRYRSATTAAFVAAERYYASVSLIRSTAAVWHQWKATWRPVEQRPTIAGVDATLDALQEIGNELDDNSPLDVDPNYAVQNLAATVERQTPRAIVAIRQTADVVQRAGGDRLDARLIERVATSRALERPPLVRIFDDLPFAISLEPRVGLVLDAPYRATRAATQRFEQRVDRILATLQRTPRDRAAVERVARHAIDAHIALWRKTLAESDRLVTQRRAAQRARRRLIVGLAIVAVLLGALALTITIRHMARRDRMALAAAQLESDKLRAELHQVSAERALRLQEAQFRSVFENADFGIVIYSRDGTVLQVNAAVNAMLGNRRDAILANRQATIDAFDIKFARDSLALEELHPRDGSPQWLAFTFSGVYDEGACQMVILLLRDTTEEQLLQQGLVYPATHDGLTNIANRSAFENELLSDANSSTPEALLYIDLDAFKPINDTYGHAAGDHVLVVTAERLRSALASSDFCARLGGDEFAALVRGCADLATLTSIASRIVATIALPIPFGDEMVAVTASVGVATRAAGDASSDRLKIAADRALYAAKSKGGNAFEICTLITATSALSASIA